MVDAIFSESNDDRLMMEQKMWSLELYCVWLNIIGRLYKVNNLHQYHSPEKSYLVPNRRDIESEHSGCGVLTAQVTGRSSLVSAFNPCSGCLLRGLSAPSMLTSSIEFCVEF